MGAEGGEDVGGAVGGVAFDYGEEAGGGVEVVDGGEDAAEEAGEDGEAVAEVEGDEVFDGLGVEGGRGEGDDEGGVAGDVCRGALEAGDGRRGLVEDGVDVFGYFFGREDFWRARS